MLLLPAQPPLASIADLKDIPPPPPISYAPQTAGWWVVGAILLAALLVVAYRKWRTWRRNRYRREAQAELVAIERAVAIPMHREQALAALPVLVKRTVLAWAPRHEVGPMTGEAWLSFLDGTFPAGGFVKGPGRHLEALAYGQDNLESGDLTALIALLHRWIDGHVAA